METKKFYGVSEKRVLEIVEIMLNMENPHLELPLDLMFIYVCNQCHIVNMNEKKLIYDAVKSGYENNDNILSIININELQLN